MEKRALELHKKSIIIDGLEYAPSVGNLPDIEAVEVNAEGQRKQLEKLIGYLEVGPSTAKITKVVTNWSEYTGSYSGFKVRY